MFANEIGIIFIAAAVIAIILYMLKQPIIPAYVLAGILVGPLFLGLVNHPEAITELSELAVVIMLFVIGIEMDLSRLKKVGLVAILGGSAQVITTFFVGFGLGKLFGLANIASAYLGFALSFSSTMLVVKILSEKYDMETLYGRIVVGILIIQDIFAIFALAIFATANNFSPQLLLSTSTLAAGLILVVVFICGKFIFPRVFDKVAKEREILFIVTVAILFLVAFYARSQHLSLSIGSFLAGLAIAGLSYRYEIIGDLKALKSFFTILFFVALGLQVAPLSMFEGQEGSKISIFLGSVYENLGLIVVFTLAAFLVKPLIIMLIVSVFGYKKATVTNCGLSLAQLSEFSLVIVAQGVASGHLDSSILSPIIIVTVVTMVFSSYFMGYNLFLNRLLDSLTGWLGRFSAFKPSFDFTPEEADNFQVLIVGRDRLGRIIEQALRELKVKYVVVDSNPEVIASLKKEGVPCIFGDVNNHEVLERLNFEKLTTVFSSVPDPRDNELLINHINKVNPSVNFIGICDSRTEAERLYQLGAHYVLVTYLLAGTQLIRSKGEHEDSVSLGSFLKDVGAVRTKGKRHRESLFTEPFVLHELGPTGDEEENPS